MLPFEDIIGYAFRRAVARAIQLDAAQYVKADHHPPVVDQISHRKWTGEGEFSSFVRSCPFEFVVWVCSVEGRKLKLRSEMDIARHHSMIWYLGSIVDIWVKTPMLTFNRAFPDEINVFKPALCEPDELADHCRFADLLNLRPEFETAYLAGLPSTDREAGRRLLSVVGSQPTA